MTAEYKVSIAGRVISSDTSPYIIAELSANHNGRIETAFSIMDAAKAAGADAVKLQTYRADTITIDHSGNGFNIETGLWAGKTLYELYQEAHMPWDWHAPLFEYARKIGITLFSSPFDQSAVDLLENLDAPAYKIASFEVVDLALIRYVASTGKPMIMSTGMANEEEIGEAVDAARSAGCSSLILLHCVSAYPARASEYNLQTLVDMRCRYGVPTGLSDHTIDNSTAIAAVALGACVIEKHVTLDRNGGGPDDSFSLEPAEFVSLCQMCKSAWSSLGQVSYDRSDSELGNIQFRRSLYVVADVAAGDVLSVDNVRSIRPGYGLLPKHLDEVLGRRVNKAVSRGTPVDWGMLS
jgi:N-acetylneuraminate synthase